jgi:hypothetical protein
VIFFAIFSPVVGELSRYFESAMAFIVKSDVFTVIMQTRGAAIGSPFNLVAANISRSAQLKQTYCLFGHMERHPGGG